MSRKPPVNVSNHVSKCSKEQIHTHAAMPPENDLQAPVVSLGAELLKTFGIPQADLARASAMSRATISRLLVHGQWPAYGADLLLQNIQGYLVRRGLTPNQVQRITQALQNKLAPECSQHAEAVPASPTNETEKEAPMLLANAGLRPETRAHFKLPRNPFIDDVQSPDDVFQTPSVRYIRAALTDCAMHHGFLAVVGESGSGKTTLAEDLGERIRQEARPIILIKPYVLAMEGNDERGKTLKSTQIAESIAVSLDPSVRLRTSSEARFRQLHTLLATSRRSGQRHLLIIEEAHCLPLATLKHLKRFLELKDGMQRLLGIALIGQPELRERLSGQNAEVREVAQRCEIVELEPLDHELEAYLQHKFARFDLKLSDVFAPDAFDAMRARLIHRPRGAKPLDARSLCFPLVVNNLVCRAMNAAASAHWPQVDAQVVAGC